MFCKLSDESWDLNSGVHAPNHCPKFELRDLSYPIAMPHY